MCPDTGRGHDISTSGIPFNISHAVVLCDVHLHYVGREPGLTFGLFTLVVEVPELEIEMSLD